MARTSPYVKFYIQVEEKKKGRPLSDEELIKLFENRGICPHCERFALPCEGYTAVKHVYQCGSCGWKGQSKTVKEYLEGGYYR